MSELSVFIDESGDFGEHGKMPDYYLVTFVFHDQDDDISVQIKKLDESLNYLDMTVEYIHTGPIIRKEGVFKDYTIDERRSLIYRIFNFVLKCPIQYYTLVINRKEASDRVQLSGNIARAIKLMLDRTSEDKKRGNQIE